MWVLTSSETSLESLCIYYKTVSMKTRNENALFIGMKTRKENALLFVCHILKHPGKNKVFKNRIILKLHHYKALLYPL